MPKTEPDKTLLTPGAATKGTEAFLLLEKAVYTALEYYSNVHRGSGHHSMVSTRLFDQAREMVLKYMDLPAKKYVVIFCTPRSEAILKAQLRAGSYQSVSSKDLALPLAVRAVVVEKRALPEGIPFYTGGGNARLVSPEWIVWAKAPDKYEAGTPAIINIIAFARALQLTTQLGKEAFSGGVFPKFTAEEILYHDELDACTGSVLLEKLKQTLIGKGNLVPTVEGECRFTNLDNAASTPTFTPVWNAVLQTWRQPLKVQQDIIREAGLICSRFLGASLQEYEMIFTANTTEAINIAAENLGRENDKDIEPVVLSTLLEHTSNDLPWRMITDVSIIRMNVGADGFIDTVELETILSDYNQLHRHGNKRIRLMTVTGASNVLGIFNNIEAISQIVHKYDARLLVDAAQLVAHRKVDMEAWGIDGLACSAHKAYAPFGTGILVMRKKWVHFKPEELEKIKASGEENAAGIAALGKAMVILQRIGMDRIQKEEQEITARALKGLTEIGSLTLYGIKDAGAPDFTNKGGVIAFFMKGTMSDQVAKELASYGIGIRAGCHCAHILVKHILGVGPKLQRFQRIIARLFPRLNFPGVARVSFGIENDTEDVEKLIRVMTKITTQPVKFGYKKFTPDIKVFIKSVVEKVYG